MRRGGKGRTREEKKGGEGRGEGEGGKVREEKTGRVEERNIFLVIRFLHAESRGREGGRAPQIFQLR